MKICFFTENYYIGGLDTFIINLLNTWPDSSDELILICNATHPGLEHIEKRTNRKISIIKYNRIFTTKISQGQSSSRIGQSFLLRKFIKFVYRIIQYPILLPFYTFSLIFEFRISDFERLMVINGGYPASLLCRCAIIAWRFSGKSTLAILNFHNLVSKPPWQVSLPEYLIDWAVMKSSSYIVSVSNNCLSTLNNRKAFLNYKHKHYIYNGIEDIGSLSLIHQNNTKVSDFNSQYCLMLSTYEARKGHFYLLKAFKIILEEFPEMYLKIYGYGTFSEKERVNLSIKQLSLQNRVSINNYTNDSVSLIANASVLVVPSQSYESFGLTIIEAMALGTPVVATNVGGIPEVISDSNAGYICDKDNPAEFADKIKRILRDPILANELGNNGRATFETKFQASTMSKRYESLIKNHE